MFEASGVHVFLFADVWPWFFGVQGSGGKGSGLIIPYPINAKP